MCAACAPVHWSPDGRAGELREFQVDPGHELLQLFGDAYLVVMSRADVAKRFGQITYLPRSVLAYLIQ